MPAPLLIDRGRGRLKKYVKIALTERPLWCALCCRLRVSWGVERPLVSIGESGAGDSERVHDDQQGPLHRDPRRFVPHSRPVSPSFELQVKSDAYKAFGKRRQKNEMGEPT